MSEKTEKPTPKRLRDSRKKGQVSKSKEIATCAAIVSLFIYFWLFFDFYLERLKHLVQVPSQYFHLPFEQALIGCARNGFQNFVLLVLPFAFTAMFATILAYLMQIGFLVAFEPIKPDIKKISPIQGVKRIFSLNSLLELGKSIVKILLLGTIVYLLVKDNIGNLLHIPQGIPQTALDVLAAILKKLVVAVSALFIIVAIIDHFFQKHLHIRKLKMSKDEIKREYKDREGDPHFKQRRRQLQIEMTMDDMATKIRQSTVVFTHSKNKAVVVWYEMGKTALPIISVKGKNLAADRIISLARKYGIPIEADAVLARKLYENCKQDNYITSEYIEPVAVVLRKVMGLDGQANA